MADTKISALGDVTTLAAGDKVAVADASDLTVSKSATMTEINTYLRTLPLSSAEITTLPAAATITSTDTFAVDQGGTAGEANFTQLLPYLKTVGFPVTVHLGSQYTNSNTTGTEVTGLQFAGVVAGTYYVRWLLFVQSAATTTSWKFGVNYTGTVTKMCNYAKFPSAGVTAATGTAHDANNATTGQVFAYANSRTETTTAPNLGPWIGVTNTAVNHLVAVETLVVVSDTGDLELWAAADEAAQMSIEVGSSGILIRTN